MKRVPFAALNALPEAFRGGALAVGNFDGMHRGHHALFAATRSEAEAHGGKALMLTFEPHPRAVLRPNEPLFCLTPLSAKARLAAAFGLDGIVVARFDAAFAAMSAADFVASELVGRLGIHAVAVGHDFHFGHDRLGSPDFLSQAGAQYGFTTRIVDAVTDSEGRPYSASRIRRLLAAGDIVEANRALGYRWFVIGDVQHGDKRGRTLGYPTANIRLSAECGLALGIYAVTLTRRDGRVLPAVASYGRRPTFDNGAVVLEVHVFDFSDDIYDEEVCVTLHAYLRGEERFDSIDALIAQMDRDSHAARAILAEAGPGTPIDIRLTSGFGLQGPE